MVNREKEARDRAEAMFKKTENRRRELAAEHETEANALRLKTERLRTLRLAAEADQRLRKLDAPSRYCGQPTTLADRVPPDGNNKV